VDGLRTALIGASHYGLAADTAVLLFGATLVLFIGSHLFSKIQV